MPTPAVCHAPPLLSAWVAFVARLTAGVCQLLELDSDHCPLAWLAGAQPGALHRIGSMASCLHPGWLASLSLTLLLAALATALSARRLLRWLSLREGGRMTAAAAAVVRELRKVQPAAYPAVRHMFGPAPGREQLGADALSLMLCAVCHGGAAHAAGADV